MTDSTTFIDAGGIRRDRPTLPRRHPVDPRNLEFLAILADLGEPGSPERQGWENLLRVHGIAAVVQATARCFHQVGHSGKVRNAQAQQVLDGALPGGQGVTRHGSYRRRSQVA